MVQTLPSRPILVVDDEPEMLRSLRSLLRMEFTVFTAGSAKEGARVLQEETIHIVMTDQCMPEMTGVEFLKQIKCRHPEAIRVIFTGYADVNAVIDAINMGNVYRYVSKPWDPDQLITLLREAGDRYDVLAERRQLLEDLRLHQEAWLEFERHIEDIHAQPLGPQDEAQRHRLDDEGRQLLGRLGKALAAISVGRGL